MTIIENPLVLSGRVFVAGDEVIWETHRKVVLLRVPILEIQAIGEYTTARGPAQDDWFIVFVLGRKEFRSISVYAVGMADVLEELSWRLGDAIQCQFANSVVWKSQVIWPPDWKGLTVLKASPKLPKNIWEEFKLHMGFMDDDVALTDELKYKLSQD